MLDFENRCDDALSDLFLNKKMPEFWKVWSSKFRRNSVSDVFINGSNNPCYVACVSPLTMKIATKFEVDTIIRCLVIAFLMLIHYVTL